MKREFSGQIVQKYSDIKFRENSFRGSRVIQCGRTERWTGRYKESNNNNKLQLVYHPVAVVILHVHKYVKSN
jgi:hypothetical protein